MIYLGIFALCTISLLLGYVIGRRFGYRDGVADANWRELEY